MRLVIDFDNTLANSCKAVYDLYREETGDLSTKLEDLDGWWFDKITPLWSREEQLEAFNKPRFYELLELNEGAAEAINYLKYNGHEIAICTVHNPDGIPYKARYIKERLPKVDQVIYIDNDDKTDKSWICGTVMIDDSIDNLESVSCEVPICFGNYAWNKEWDGCRTSSWNDFCNNFKKVEEE